MRTDQLGQRLKISGEIYLIKLRWWWNLIAQAVGFPIIVVAAYLFFSRPRFGIEPLQGIWAVPDPYAAMWLFRTEKGNGLLFLIGVAIALYANRPKP